MIKAQKFDFSRKKFTFSSVFEGIFGQIRGTPQFEMSGDYSIFLIKKFFRWTKFKKKYGFFYTTLTLKK